MSPRVFTIVSGSAYAAMAAVTVPLMTLALGCDVEVVRGERDCWAQKLRPMASDVYTFVDVDVVFRRRYCLRSAIEAAADGCYVAPSAPYAERLSLPRPFVTNGFFTAHGQRMASVLARARELYRPGGVASLKEEYALNQSLREHRTPLLLLPETHHRVLPDYRNPDPADYSRHYCGGVNDERARLWAIRAAATEARSVGLS